MKIEGDIVKFWKYKGTTFLVITNDGKTVFTVPVPEKTVPDFVKNNIHFEDGCDFVLSNVEAVKYTLIFVDIIANGETDPEDKRDTVMIYGRSNNKN
jgi:hypothetical protein